MRVLLKAHRAHMARAESVIRQFDDMALTAVASRDCIQRDMRADRTRATIATDSPRMVRGGTRNRAILVHPGERTLPLP